MNSLTLIKTLTVLGTLTVANVCGIVGIGYYNAQPYSDYSIDGWINTMDNLMNTSPEELTKIPDIGEIIAKSVTDYFNDSSNRGIPNPKINLSNEFSLLFSIASSKLLIDLSPKPSNLTKSFSYCFNE